MQGQPRSTSCQPIFNRCHICLGFCEPLPELGNADGSSSRKMASLRHKTLEVCLLFTLPPWLRVLPCNWRFLPMSAPLFVSCISSFSNTLLGKGLPVCFGSAWVMVGWIKSSDVAWPSLEKTSMLLLWGGPSLQNKATERREFALIGLQQCFACASIGSVSLEFTSSMAFRKAPSSQNPRSGHQRQAGVVCMGEHGLTRRTKQACVL